MTAHRPSRLRRRHLEQLLDGAPADGELARLLDLARRPGEATRRAAGEAEVVAAFRAAAPEQGGATPTRSATVPTIGIRKLVAVKVLAVAAAVTTVGGVAVAATQGGHGDRPGVTAARPAQPTASWSAPSTPWHPSTPGERRSGTPTAPAPKPPRVTHPSARQLQLASACVVWRYQSAHGTAQTLPPAVAAQLRARHVSVPSTPTPPQIADLIKAAGGPAAVPGYCAALVRTVCVTWERPARAGSTPAIRAECPFERPFDQAQRTPARPTTTAPPAHR